MLVFWEKNDPKTLQYFQFRCGAPVSPQQQTWSHKPSGIPSHTCLPWTKPQPYSRGPLRGFRESDMTISFDSCCRLSPGLSRKGWRSIPNSRWPKFHIRYTLSLIGRASVYTLLPSARSGSLVLGRKLWWFVLCVCVCAFRGLLTTYDRNIWTSHGVCTWRKGEILQRSTTRDVSVSCFFITDRSGEVGAADDFFGSWRPAATESTGWKGSLPEFWWTPQGPRRVKWAWRFFIGQDVGLSWKGS